MSEKIFVTKSYLPPKEEYTAYLTGIWERSHLTNQGPLVLELEQKLRDYLDVEHLHFASNGTIVLQMALKALKITGEVITTPFSYCATSHVIAWENATPIFADIREEDLCIDPDCIEALITPKTQAILATHVYGIPCQLERIEALAKKHNLYVIYDAAHTFGVKVDGKSLLSFGDVSTCSFHATKVFHTVEGGMITTPHQELSEQLKLYRSFGHIGDEYFDIGINAKNSEFHAAMGLCNLPHVQEIIAGRHRVTESYDHQLNWSKLRKPVIPKNVEWNHAYYPIFFKTEADLLRTRQALEAQQIFTRRYFYPSLNTLTFLHAQQSCPVSEAMALRALCLPLYPDLSDTDVQRIISIVNENL
ncbi:DegT/DnrJ/EryC1/StrS aminotransferase family protein [Siphonobacter sp. SORGH_AS_1065]|uniref:DegT/DnrJ/EryC1/StrS family aminotransferase n=1 Tax=Siphonobacter sp. SORGH_AS_1065 TaxID=3041795 RepID=UPI002781B1E5|nr:DegT/DnrJ/EryC1/StrS family aminotransferase [Siphonobacter sp. SORGH_AS_1065]MDQ1088734.1 dTDP-4-amino-4,6-dideoxygalactose transaminase [Siphonobacter sp. SORGH_AS_1065]